MNPLVVAITGLSGVGKSILINALAASTPLTHLQASTLIRDGRRYSGGGVILQDQLRLADIDQNQQHLILGFKRVTTAITGLIVLDAHTVIERDDGLSRIAGYTFGAIGMCCMIFLVDDPEVIFRRRLNDTERKRPMPSIDVLRAFQEEAQAQATLICCELGVPLHVCRVGDFESIAELLREMHRV